MTTSAKQELTLYRDLMERITDGFMALDRDWRFVYVNGRAGELLQKPPVALIGSTFWDAFPESEGSIFHREYHRAVEEQVAAHFEAPSVFVDRSFSVHAYPSEDGLSIYFTDITERRDAEAARRESEQRYRALFEESRDAIYVTTREGELVAINRSGLELFGYTREEILALNVRELYADPRDRIRFQEAIEREGAVRGFELRLARSDGGKVHGILSSTVRRGSDGRVVGYQGIIHDVTDRKRAEQQLLHDAMHDSLTGLPNRALFMDRLGGAMARMERRPERRFAVLFLDVDRFKVVNDSLGHRSGDALLVAIAERLKTSLSPGDTVARIGGDEFTILLNELDNASDATRAAERIQQELAAPFTLRGHEFFATASIGIAVCDADYDEAEELLRNADIAMYRAKELGRARHAVFDTDMHARAVELLKLETDLRRAVEREEFRVHYQPIVSLDSREITGFEALVRWMHPERGLLPPAEFLPLAEETGLIVPIDWWVLRVACAEIQRLEREVAPGRQLALSVNLSAKQLAQPSFVGEIQRILGETGLDPRSLRLEITENMIMESITSATSKFAELKSLGIELCIDDFGTGYSSLSYLHRLPIDTLKIDRSFISRLGADGAEDLEIVQTIVTLAQNLGLDIIPEGVETPEHLAHLKQMRCRYGQGFLFSRPVDAEGARKLFEKQTA